MSDAGDAIALVMGSQADVRRRLLGDFSVRSEKPDDELQRAYERAHAIVAERGRGMEDEVLLLARAVVRLSSHMVELSERQSAAEAIRDTRRVDQATEVAELTLQLAGARERIRVMMRQQAVVLSERERAIELMLAMLDKAADRVRDHPEWIEELGKLSGVT